jgi:8-oxo-dGTP pyrophosphatase MutT (NUDIX family)
MRLAATVMLVRDRAAGGIEILMVRRSARSPFAPDAFVFPGGTVDPQDYDRVLDGWPPERIPIEFRAEVPDALPTDASPLGARDANALVAAAVRELHEEAAITIDPSQLLLFSHWVTPPDEPRRYDTHFFLARAPADALGVADAFETHDARWIEPGDALARNLRGELHLVYPTIKHLERLRAFDVVDALLAFAQEKPIRTIMPGCAPSEGFVMPVHLENAW